MNKRVSPAVAVIVVIAALVAGVLYFMMRYRDAVDPFSREKAALQRRLEQTGASSRAGREGPPAGSGWRDRPTPRAQRESEAPTEDEEGS